MKNSKNRTDKSQKIELEDSSDPIAKGFFARIEPGIYDAECIKTEIASTSFGPKANKGKKIYNWFRIIGGVYDGLELFMACNFYPAKEMSLRCKYYEQWSIANGGTPNAGQRMGRGIFKGKRFRVKVIDTKRKDDDGSIKSDSVQYSIVERIIELIE